MKIILNQDVVNLGEEGDVKEVANGYARNYLIPRNFAVPYNKYYLNQFELRKEAIEKRKEEKRKAAMSLKERIEGEEIVMEMPAGSSGKLFGSVNNSNIVAALEKKGIEVEKKKVEVPGQTLKTIGDYKVKIKLYGNEESTIMVKIRKAGAGDEKKEEASDKAKKAVESESERSKGEEEIAEQPSEEVASEAEENIEDKIEE